MTESRESEPVSSEGDDDATVAPLPDPVRARVIALAAEGLGRMPVEILPTSLKRVASFAPAAAGEARRQPDRRCARERR